MTLDDRLRQAAAETRRYLAGAEAPEPPRRSRLTQLVGGVAGVVVVLGALASGAILWPGSADENEATGPDPSSTMVPTTSDPTATTSTLHPTTTAPPIAVPSSWIRVPPEQVAGVGMMNSVAEGGPGLVAVGWTQQGDDRDAAVWVSTDGSMWEQVSHDPSVFGGAGVQVINAVAAGGPGLVAVGYDSSPGAASHAAVWVSTDGLTWQRIADDDAVFGGAQVVEMAAVTVGGPGLVAVGAAITVGGFDAAVWTSVDGLSWIRVPHNDADFGGPGSQFMADVVALGDRLIAVGTDGPAQAQHAAVWASPDGTGWERVGHQLAFVETGQSGGMAAVTVGGPGLVGVGSYTDDSGASSHAALWTSVDGVNWQRVPHVDEIFGGLGDQGMVAVAAAGSGLVAVGSDARGEAFSAAVWNSPDGTNWHRVPHNPDFGGPPDGHSAIMKSIVSTTTHMVAVGWDEGRPAVWLGPPPT